LRSDCFPTAPIRRTIRKTAAKKNIKTGAGDERANDKIDENDKIDKAAAGIPRRAGGLRYRSFCGIFSALKGVLHLQLQSLPEIPASVSPLLLDESDQPRIGLQRDPPGEAPIGLGLGYIALKL